MSHSKQEIHLQLHQLADALMLGLLFWAVYLLRTQGWLAFDHLPNIQDFKSFLWMMILIAPLAPFLLELQGYYYYPLEKTIGKSIVQITRATFWLIILLALSSFLLRLSIPSRSVLIVFSLCAPTALILRERLFIAIYKHRLASGTLSEPIILAGEPSGMIEIEKALTPTQRLEMQIVSRINLQTQEVDALIDAIHTYSVGRVILIFHTLDIKQIQRAIEACEQEGVEVWLCADFIRSAIGRPHFELLAHRPMLVFRMTSATAWALFIKELLDRLLAAISLILALPLFCMITLGIKWTSPGPAIFRQKRAGLHGRPFILYKFRSMDTNAEMRQAELQAFNMMQGPVFKVAQDPRITPFGQWLRKTSLDELPQLFNVLKGEMSLVGPRPLPLYEVQQFEQPSHRRRLSMKPGLTCLWQIRGRNRVTNFEEWIRMDLEYIDTWSLQLDFWILLRTIPVVFFGLGAH